MILNIFERAMVVFLFAVTLKDDAGLCSARFLFQQEDTFNYDMTVGNNFGPSDWDQVTCNRTGCPGFPDDWEMWNDFIPYAESPNMCLHCDEGSKWNEKGQRTPRHQQHGGECYEHKQSPIHLFRNITYHRLCHDRHLMAFIRGTCPFQDMKFSIERHALRAHQPLDEFGQIACQEPSNIDFSQGFPRPWNLIYTDIKVPGEHMMDGVAYAAEVVMAHVYSVDKVDRYIGKVAVLLQEGEESDYYDFLDLYLRRWRRERKIIWQNCQARVLNVTRRELAVAADAEDELTFGDLDFIQLKEQRRRLGRFANKAFRRRFHVCCFVQYYFRYEGSQGVPPCLELVHWRVLKDPVKVAPSQIEILQRLLAIRLDPDTCEPDTAGRRISPMRVEVNRPIQTTTNAHKLVFCECLDWTSHRQRDRDWCELPMEERGVLHHKRSNLTNAPTAAP